MNTLMNVNVLDLSGPAFLQLYVTLLAAAVVVAVVLRYLLRYPGGNPPTQSLPDLHPFEVAYLAGGAKSVTDSAIAALVERGSIEVKNRKLVASALAPADVTPLERAVYDAVKSSDGRVGPVRRKVRDMTRSVASRVEALELAMPPGRALLARIAPAGVFAALLCLGISKIFIGMNRHRPVEYLFMLCFVTFVMFAILFTMRHIRTRRGTLTLGRLRTANAALRATASRAPNSLAGNDLSMAFALYGAGVFAFGPMSDLKRTLAPPSAGGTGCGSVSGCGSSGCGSGGGSGCGGGGCGGCGGGGGD